MVGVRDEELVDEVALAAHHLDAVVAGLARELRATHEGADLALDAAHAQRTRRERRDRALDARRRHAQRLVAVAAGVQDLQCDAAAFGVHRVGDDSVPARAPPLVDKVPAKGLAQPSMLGAKPPVTISPTPPRARSAKNAAIAGKCLRPSSSPVCMLPISRRFFRVTKPRFKGSNRRGNGVAAGEFKGAPARPGVGRPW